jgi:quinol monooxygenase YgiN
LLVTLEARRGKEADAEAFLKSALPLALDEKGTLKWYAIKLGPAKFSIFDTFANEGGRNAHLTGEIAKALGGRANELLADPPQVEKVEVLASPKPASFFQERPPQVVEVAPQLLHHWTRRDLLLFGIDRSG